MSQTIRSIRAGRPPKIIGGAVRWSVYVNPQRRDAALARAAREGVELPDVLRAFLDQYAAGTIDPPKVSP